VETLKFDFAQKAFDKKEIGICYLKRPHFLKCLYEDKNQKELIINKRILVIYHKRYNKIYRYPLSKSYFIQILNREKFSEVIMKGKMQINDDFSEIEYLDENKGQIIFYFNNKNYDLVGWKLIDINNNITVFEMSNQSKNIEIKKTFFSIPEGNQ
jgi:outer membrane lipoprotein-sorting protein